MRLTKTFLLALSSMAISGTMGDLIGAYDRLYLYYAYRMDLAAAGGTKSKVLAKGCLNCPTGNLGTFVNYLNGVPGQASLSVVDPVSDPAGAAQALVTAGVTDVPFNSGLLYGRLGPNDPDGAFIIATRAITTFQNVSSPALVTASTRIIQTLQRMHRAAVASDIAKGLGDEYGKDKIAYDSNGGIDMGTTLKNVADGVQGQFTAVQFRLMLAQKFADKFVKPKEKEEVQNKFEKAASKIGNLKAAIGVIDKVVNLMCPT